MKLAFRITHPMVENSIQEKVIQGLEKEVSICKAEKSVVTICSTKSYVPINTLNAGVG